MYDVTRAETFDSLADIWLREAEVYGTVQDSIKMVVANKTDVVGGQACGQQAGALERVWSPSLAGAARAGCVGRQHGRAGPLPTHLCWMPCRRQPRHPGASPLRRRSSER